MIQLDQELRTQIILPKEKPVADFVPHATGAVKDLVTGNVYTQPTASAQAALGKGINGQPALDFDGSNDCISYTPPDNFPRGNSPWTIVSAFKPESTGAYRGLFLWGNAGGKGVYFGLSNTQKLNISKMGVAGPMDSGDAVKINQFNTASIAHGGTTTRFCLNGRSQSEQAATYDIDTESISGRFGCYVTGVEFFSGLQQRIQLYGVALSITERVSLEKHLRTQVILPKEKPETVFMPVSDGLMLDVMGNRIATPQTPGYPSIASGGLNGNVVMDFDGVNSHGLDISPAYNLQDSWSMHFLADFNPGLVEYYFTQSNAANSNIFTIYTGYNTGGVNYLTILLTNGSTFTTLIAEGDIPAGLCLLSITYNKDTYRKNYFISGRYVEPTIRADGEIVSAINTNCKLGTRYNEVNVLNRSFQEQRFYQREQSASEIAGLHKYLRTI